MALPLSPLSKYATVDSRPMEVPNHYRPKLGIKLHNNTSLEHHIGTFIALTPVYRMIFFVIVGLPPVNLGRKALFMSKIEDCNVARLSYNRTQRSETRGTAWIKHVSKLPNKEKIDNNYDNPVRLLFSDEILKLPQTSSRNWHLTSLSCKINAVSFNPWYGIK